MKTATITEIKNGLSAIIDQVRAGESVLITDRGLVVARLGASHERPSTSRSPAPARACRGHPRLRGSPAAGPAAPARTGVAGRHQCCPDPDRGAVLGSMRFWDSSAIVPLVVAERSSAAVLDELERDPDIVAWWATEVECVSALARLEQDGGLDGPALAQALARLDALVDAWQEVQPIARIRQVAVRLLRVHELRAADALQLGAALAAAEDQPASLPIVTLDDRLGRAAEREGFRVGATGMTASAPIPRPDPIRPPWPGHGDVARQSRGRPARGRAGRAPAPDRPPPRRGGGRPPQRLPGRSVARLRRTLRTTLAMVFGDGPTAERAVRRLNGVHATVRGEATDPGLGAGIGPDLPRHGPGVAPVGPGDAGLGRASRPTSRWVEPLDAADREELWAEAREVGRRLGIPLEASPADWPALEAYWARMTAPDGPIAITSTARRLAASIVRPSIWASQHRSSTSWRHPAWPSSQSGSAPRTASRGGRSAPRWRASRMRAFGSGSG